MLTAILLLERGHLDDIVTAPNGVQYLPDSSLHLKPGEKLTLRDLLYAMLLRSANDTAVTGAVYLSGSVPAFAKQMNEKAKEIGATHSPFCHAERPACAGALLDGGGSGQDRLLCAQQSAAVQRRSCGRRSIKSIAR